MIPSSRGLGGSAPDLPDPGPTMRLKMTRATSAYAPRADCVVHARCGVCHQFCDSIIMDSSTTVKSFYSSKTPAVMEVVSLTFGCIS